jgi:hypothetical protein
VTLYHIFRFRKVLKCNFLFHLFIHIFVNYHICHIRVNHLLHCIPTICLEELCLTIQNKAILFFLIGNNDELSVLLYEDHRVTRAILLDISVKVVDKYLMLSFSLLIHLLNYFLALVPDPLFVPFPQQVQAQIVQVANKFIG